MATEAKSRAKTATRSAIPSDIGVENVAAPSRSMVRRSLAGFPGGTRVPIYVGFSATAEAAAGKLVAAPKPPANYKSAEAIQEWMVNVFPQRMDALKSRMSSIKMLGILSDIYAVDPANKRVFDWHKFTEDDLGQLAGPEVELLQNAGIYKPAAAFAMWLLSSYPQSFSDSLPAGAVRVAFYGFDVKTFVRLVGINSLKADLRVPLQLWYGNTECYDPYAMLVESDERETLSLSSLLQMTGELEEGRVYTPHVNVQADAVMACNLVSSWNLLHVDNAQLAERLSESPASVVSAEEPAPPAEA